MTNPNRTGQIEKVATNESEKFTHIPSYNKGRKEGTIEEKQRVYGKLREIGVGNINIYKQFIEETGQALRFSSWKFHKKIGGVE